MRVEVEQLAGGLEETHSAGGHLSAVKRRLEVELESSPGTGSELTQKLAVVAKEDPQPFGDGKDHLAVGDVFEQLLLGPGRPQQLPLLMTAWTKAAQLAGEGDQKLVPAVGTADAGQTLVEDPAVEIAIDGGLHTAA
ncbi:MAG: hypothetical protein WBH75_00345 [Thermoanaerobaculia bacterium]